MDGPSRRLSNEDEACWVCLEGANEAAGPLEHPCACPRGVHAKCLARWQLQSAGRDEERFCRFCKHELPDWRSALTPKVPEAPPVMAIVYDGKVVRLQVKPGKAGMEEFQRQVRKAFNLGEDVELDCVFDCRAPGSGEKIKLRGLESYSAAMHCASVAAGERLAKMSSTATTTPAGSRAATATQLPATCPSSRSSGGTTAAHSAGGNGTITVPPSSQILPTRSWPHGASAAAAAVPACESSSGSLAGTLQSPSQSTCHAARLRSPRLDGGHSWGIGNSGSSGSNPGAGSRRRNLFADFFRSFAAARRVM